MLQVLGRVSQNLEGTRDLTCCAPLLWRCKRSLEPLTDPSFSCEPLHVLPALAQSDWTLSCDQSRVCPALPQNSLGRVRQLKRLTSPLQVFASFCNNRSPPKKAFQTVKGAATGKSLRFTKAGNRAQRGSSEMTITQLGDSATA